MSVSCAELFNLIENFAPLNLAEEWDNPGLQIGDPGLKINRILLCLDVDEKACDEAVQAGVQLIISHHPLLFKPVKQILTNTPAGALLAKCLCSGLVVYSAHTNLDNARGGVNDELAKRLGLVNTKVLRPGQTENYLKLVVFVPPDHADGVRRAVSHAGAGWIGNYSECTFQTQGTGTFRPLEGSDPFIGKVGELEKVDEVRLETILPAGRAKDVINAMCGAHPYEEVAYDLYPLANKGPAMGTGRYGLTSQPLKLNIFIEKIKSALGINNVRFGGDPDGTIHNVAVCGGAGASLWPWAKKTGADVMVTSDIDYHTARDMLSNGLSFVDAGHFGTENIIIPVLGKYLEDCCRQKGFEVEVMTSQTQSDPFGFSQ
ncbi:MAG: NGG1p interacting factor 3 protein, NIF3 [Desulfotomaculum sp. 46_296]|nr:MAG: NGG1p interacting factor 3 protein, NIF3 [Desulfotomaculum sp. 46_296]HAU32695.1 Nif3-like dinuclear metal center hexameric protein [Desulfotomaculum sp.]